MILLREISLDAMYNNIPMFSASVLEKQALPVQSCITLVFPHQSTEAAQHCSAFSDSPYPFAVNDCGVKRLQAAGAQCDLLQLLS